MRASIGAGALALALAFGAAEARAGGTATGFNIESFKPVADPFGYASVNGARSLEALQPYAGAAVNWARNPIRFSADSDIAGGPDVVRDLTVLDLTLGLGVLSLGDGAGLSLGVDLPIVLEENGLRLDDRSARFDDQGLGALRTDAKLTLLSRDGDGVPLGVAIRAFGEWKTGRERALLSDNGSNSFGATLILEKRIGRLRLAAEGGYQWIDGRAAIVDFVIDDKLLLSGAAAFDIAEGFSVFGEVLHWTPIAAPWKDQRLAPIELDVGLKYVGAHLSATIGGGLGLDRGVGAPDSRVFGMIGYRF